MSASKFTEKIDVLDMLINILREHEETMDELIERLELVVEVIAQKYPDTPLRNLDNIEAVI